MRMQRRSRKLSAYTVVLGSVPSANADRYCSRKAARSAHPDKGGSEAKMAAVNEAYEVLSNPGTSLPIPTVPI